MRKIFVFVIGIIIAASVGFYIGRETAPKWPASVTICQKPSEAVDIPSPPFAPPPYQSPIERWWLNTFCGQKDFSK